MDAARSREEGAAREDARGEDKKTARTERGDGRERGGEGASRSGVGQRAVPFANAPICSDVAYRRAKPGRPRRARSEASHRRHGGCYFMYLRKVRTSARAEGEFEVFNGGIEPSTDRRVFGWSGAIRALFRRAGLNLVSTSRMEEAVPTARAAAEEAVPSAAAPTGVGEKRSREAEEPALASGLDAWAEETPASAVTTGAEGRDGGGASTSGAPAVAPPAASPGGRRKRPTRKCFRYGNYHRYYGYRVGESLEDHRIPHFRREWFEGKRCDVDI